MAYPNYHGGLKPQNFLRNSNWSVCLFVLIIAHLGPPVNGMEGIPAITPEQHIRCSQSLSAGEREYVEKRKQVVVESLNRLGINCTEDSVPHIALLASGGGQRAAVALMGSLHQMEQDGLLDPLLYLGGVSGSTWSMTSLYSDPCWSGNMEQAVSRLTGPGVQLEDSLDWLEERIKEEDFSLTDIWAVITSAGIMNQMDRRRLSDEASRNVTNPYPIYSAIEKHCYSHGPIEGKWFEITPHESGFTELGLFVKTSHLGSRFQAGELMEERPEMDMVRLQVPGQIDDAGDQYLHVYHILIKLTALIRANIRDPSRLAELDNLQRILEDEINQNRSSLLESKSPEERQQLFQIWTLELIRAVETWSESLEEGLFKKRVSWLTKHALPLILKWEWGMTRNFLYNYQDSAVPPCLHMKESFLLIDAGLLINVPYPPFLGDKRDIDLIIAPEYSAGNMFETLTLARDYAAKVKKPFPKIDDKVLEEKDWPKDCYVFEGKQKEPTIIFMPLFNRQNCKDAEEVSKKMEEYSTFQLPFTPDKIEFLLETAKANMKNNKDIILREVHKAVQRRESRRNSDISS
ncbi:cytosolic phospholipase A2 gamma-like isoform X2 [Lampris incognitus]|uniref:cytosolic phospholipase A2 gamma-like isoform X2 n=1 Tax=Lampris incognitus TaxID=2546036 RepID=UPI0024B4F0EF|nr:cytosolic phospholipase A2 gamma-like isoform X2 [Lampris incognitus]